MNVNVANLYTAQAVGPIVAVVVALVGAVAAALLFFNAKRRNQYRGLLRRISAHVNFDRFLLSSILKFLYAFSALMGLTAVILARTNESRLIFLALAVLVCFFLAMTLMSVEKQPRSLWMLLKSILMVRI